jgi:ABC-type sugar transport system permease subunit
MRRESAHTRTAAGESDAGLTVERAEERLAWGLMSPALAVIALVSLAPLVWTAWESLHLHDLRMPWLGRPFIGVANYVEVFGDTRFWRAVAHTASFTVVSVSIEVALGLILALGMSRATRGRTVLRIAVLLPWAIPTVVVALLWRFMFESQSGIASTTLARVGLAPENLAWFASPRAAWVPIVIADVWKMTPFVALLLLAGLEGIDRTLYEAARMDGAGPWRQFSDITWPLLRPALAVSVLFRALDGLRVFDLIYVLTGGGPGTATEPISLYTFDALLQYLRFGFGSALAILVFVATFALAWLYIRLMRRSLTGDDA